MRVTQGRSDPELASILIGNSYDTVCWMQDLGGHHFELATSVMGVKVGNEYKWPRGALIRIRHEGGRLSNPLLERVRAGHQLVEIALREDTDPWRHGGNA